ncbi:MAG: HpcH/HpaI aldolase/citrate lyase family protein [Mycobacteriaceae bacterium]|nr:HpcH/HpaI aldolase/citrate lyase family protein [Mycobacteriaceae bacterium]
MIPPKVQMVLFGDMLPEQRFAGMDALFQEWSATGRRYELLHVRLQAARAEVDHTVSGQAGDSVGTACADLADQMQRCGQYCQYLAQQCRLTKAEAEKTFITMVVFGAMLVQQLVALTMAGGGGGVTQAALLTYGKRRIAQLFVGLVERVVAIGSSMVTKRLALIAAIGIDPLIQLEQVYVEHTRTKMDWQSAGASLAMSASGMASGIAGAKLLGRAAPRLTGTAAGRLAAGAVTGMVGVAGGALLVGPILGGQHLTPGQLLNGAASGLAGARHAVRGFGEAPAADSRRLLFDSDFAHRASDPAITHFNHIPPNIREQLFHEAPQPFRPSDDRWALANAASTTLYGPSTQSHIAAKIEKWGRSGVPSLVYDLEDGIPASHVRRGMDNLVEQFAEYAHHGTGPRPLLFVRVRTPEHITELVERLGPDAHVITGYILPKFTSADAVSREFLHTIAELNTRHGLRQYAVPIVETGDFADVQHRVRANVETKALMDEHPGLVLWLEVGSTDLSAAFGISRPENLTIYDLPPGDAVKDMNSILGAVVEREAGGRSHFEREYLLSGPGWEYFERVPPPRMLTTLERYGAAVARMHAGLIREHEISIAMGMHTTGAIHPDQVRVALAMAAVPYETYHAAQQRLGRKEEGGGGVHGAAAGAGGRIVGPPHGAWASLIMARAKAFGVLAPGVSRNHLLGASFHAARVLDRTQSQAAKRNPATAADG